MIPFFTMNAAYKAALEIIGAHERTALQPVDHEAFFSALDTPPEPTENVARCFPPSPRDRRLKVMPEDDATTFIIEPFDPDKHDRTAFSCGVEQVDNYFQKTANKLAKADNVRLYVMTDLGGSLIGFYSINAHSVHYEELPKKFERTRPSHGNIPAAYNLDDRPGSEVSWWRLWQRSSGRCLEAYRPGRRRARNCHGDARCPRLW